MPRNPETNTLQLSPAARAALENRAQYHQGQAEFSAAASAMIERYAFLVDCGLRLLQSRPEFTDAHFAAACDALERITITSRTLPRVGEYVAEAIAIDDLGRKWGLPEGAAKLFESLDALELLAIADLKERYWREVAHHQSQQTGEVLTAERFWKSFCEAGA